MYTYPEIKTAFEAQANPAKAAQMAAYMRNQFPFYGLQTPQRRALYKPLLAAARKSSVIDWELLEQCWADPHREMQYLVTDYLSAMQKHLTYEDVPRLERFIRSKQWWDTIDGLDRIVGDIGLRDDRIPALMLRWSTDPDFWVRRIAIDHQLSRKQATDTALLETIIVNNLGSSEFFINKAIGWSLREYSKTDPGWVRAFLERHRPTLSRLSLREASKRL